MKTVTQEQGRRVAIEPNDKLFDAMLIRAWRTHQTTGSLSNSCMATFGVRLHALPLKRAGGGRFIPNTMVRAYVAGHFPRLSERLWACKSDQDFIAVHRWLQDAEVQFEKDSGWRYLSEAINKSEQSRKSAVAQTMGYWATKDANRRSRSDLTAQAPGRVARRRAA